MQDESSPLAWFRAALMALQWPVIVAFAFWLGRYVQELKMRVGKMETSVTQLMERHMPAIHSALAEILGHLRGRR